jgi:beta-lactamase class D
MFQIRSEASTMKRPIVSTRVRTPWTASDEKKRGGGMTRLLAITVVLFSFQTHAADWKENPQIGQLFKNAQVNGTFVLYDPALRLFVGHDRARAETRFIPASTFKIPNTVIGLATGAVKDVDEILPYGGQPQPFKAWEKDMGLREAIAMSNAAIYQELARRIGLPRMREGISKLGYGNEDTGNSVDTFWLTGPPDDQRDRADPVPCQIGPGGIAVSTRRTGRDA